MHGDWIFLGIHHYIKIIGASLSEPHIDEANARNPYIIIIIIIMYGTSVTREPP